MRIFQPTVTGSNTTTGSLHISGPAYFYTLESSSVSHVITYNTSSGQIFFTESKAVGLRPGEPTNSIQINSDGEFSGSSNFTFLNDVVYLTGSYITSGAIVLTGSMFVTGPTFSVSASGVFFQGLPSQSQGNILVYDTSSGQVYFTSSIRGTPAPEDTYIQYNSGSTFAATGSFRFIYTSQSLQQGNNVTAFGHWSHAQGGSSVSHGTGSHAEGFGTVASGAYSHAEGYYTLASGAYSHAEGGTAFGFGSIYHKAIGDYSHVEGVNNIASGAYSHAEGGGNTTIGYASHAEGNANETKGNYSHAEGQFTKAVGLASHAEGFVTLASGNYSHAAGYATTASGQYQSVIGQFNVATTSQSAFIVGDGTDDSNRHNILFVSKSHFEVSASSVFLQGLPTSSESHVLVYNSSSGQVYFTSSFGGTTTPGGPNQSIQFNSGSEFSGSGNFSFDYTNNTVYLTGSSVTTGSATLTGSMFVSGAISASLGPNTIGFYGTASWAINAITSSYPINVTGSTSGNSLYSVRPAAGVPVDDDSTGNSIWLGSLAGANLGISALASVFIGQSAGYDINTYADLTVAIGAGAGSAIETAASAVFIGASAGANVATNSDFTVFVGSNAGSNTADVRNSTFIGASAGSEATNAYYSTFVGYEAGNKAAGALNSTYVGSYAGWSAAGALTSTFVGSYAGYSASAAVGSNFIGYYAGYRATLAVNSAFIGLEAGYSASSAQNSQFIGYQAGRYATNAYNSIFIGSQAGQDAPNAYESVFIGLAAGYSASISNASVFLGKEAGYLAKTSPSAVYIGYKAGYGAFNNQSSVFIGHEAGSSISESLESVFVGYRASGERSRGSNFIGYYAGYYSSSYSNFIGYEVGSPSSSYSTIIGFQAGRPFYNSVTNNYEDVIGNNNIVLGTSISLPTGSQDSINLGGIIFATGSHFSADPITSPNRIFTGSAGGKVGINIYPPAYNLHVSGTIAFPSLISSSQNNVVVIDSSSGQLYYMSTSSFGGGGGGGTPAPSDTYIQYNSGSAFGAEQYFRYFYNSHSLVQGINGVVLGEYGHSEGAQTRVGWRAITASAITNGLVEIYDGVDYSSLFGAAGSEVILGGLSSNRVHKLASKNYTAPTFSVQLYDTSINGLGTYNFLIGIDYIASGNVVKGPSAHAEGSTNDAIGNNSHAEGAGNDAIGFNSHAEGGSTKSIGANSHTEGASTRTLGASSHAEGSSTKAIGVGSHAEGSTTVAGYIPFIANLVSSGTASFYNDIDNSYSSQFPGSDVLINDTYYTFNSKSYSAPTFSIFLDTNATIAGTPYVVAVENPDSDRGDQDTFYGPNSHAEGFTTKAISRYSHAEGYFTFAIGEAAHSEGFQTKAIGSYSHAEGNNTVAKGQTSHAAGCYTFASGSHQFVVGQYNAISTSESVFIVGGGSSTITRSNVLFVSRSHFEVSASNTFLQGLPTSPETHVLVYNTSSGQVYYTASSAVVEGSFNSTSSIVGNGLSSSFDIVHNFGTRNLHVTVYGNGGDYETVYVDVRRPDLNTVRVVFGGTTPPTTDQFVVYVSQ